MNAVEYKNLLYVSDPQTQNDLFLTKNFIHYLIKNKINVSWKHLKSRYDSSNSNIDKEINITKNRLLSYNQVVLDSHPTNWNKLLFDFKINLENKQIIGKIPCSLESIDASLVQTINVSQVNAISIPDIKYESMFKKLGLNKQIFIDNLEYTKRDYQFYNINYFLSIGDLIINKDLSNVYVSDFFVYYVFDPSSEMVDKISEAFLNSFKWESKKILLLVNCDKEIVKEKSKKYQNHAPVLVVNDILNLDQITSIHKMGDLYFQNDKKYLLNYYDFEVSNLRNKKTIKHETNFDYESIFKNTDSSNEIKNEEIIDKEVSDKNIVNVGLYGEMFIETTRNNHAGKININNNQIAFYSHRSGWDYVMTQMFGYHNDNGIMFDGFLENAFAWRKEEYIKNKIIPYKKPWIGVFHNPPNMKPWFTDNASCANMMVNDRYFIESLRSCKGLYVLSEYHARYLREVIKRVPINVLYHPTEIPDVLFDFDNFIDNKEKKLYNIGWWQRKLNSFYQLESPFTKIRLLPNNRCSETIERLSRIERAIYNINLSQKQIDSVNLVNHIENDIYDIELSKNIVFLDLYDSSANNAIIECIARGTPILINKHPAVIEYLGENYPFYYHDYKEAENKLNNLDLIQETHQYLTNPQIVNKIKIETFLQEFERSSIYNSL